MKVIKMNEVVEQEAQSPLFTWGRVTRQPPLTDDMDRFFNFGLVNFSAGARNKFHADASDQVLLVTEGTGIVAIEGQESVVTVGEVIHIPAGEKHWHGATKDSAFSHISLTAAGTTTEQLEP